MRTFTSIFQYDRVLLQALRIYENCIVFPIHHILIYHHLYLYHRHGGGGVKGLVPPPPEGYFYSYQLCKFSLCLTECMEESILSRPTAWGLFLHDLINLKLGVVQIFTVPTQTLRLIIFRLLKL